jgi:hypothetical protein
MAKPTLVVVEGGATAPMPLLNVRPTVAARAPSNQSHAVIYRVATSDVRKALAARVRQPAFDLWSIIFGEPPPVPNVEWEGNSPHSDGLICLVDAHACFQGIKRPIGLDDNGSNVVAYVLRPRFHYVYQPHMVTVAHRRSVPPDVVFVAYVRLDRPCDWDQPGSKGVLTHWQFVEATTDGGVMLPVGYEERYLGRLW